MDLAAVKRSERWEWRIPSVTKGEEGSWVHAQCVYDKNGDREFEIIGTARSRTEANLMLRRIFAGAHAALLAIEKVEDHDGSG